MFYIKDLVARLATRFFGRFGKSNRAFVYLVTNEGKIKRFYIDDLMKKSFPERA